MDELLSAYADGETTPAESARVRSHVADCRACGLRLEVLAKSKKALASLEVPALPRDYKEALLREAAKAEASSRTSAGSSPAGPSLLFGWRAFLSPRFGFAFGLAAFVLVGLWFERKHDEPVPLDIMLSAHRRFALARPLDTPDSRSAEAGPDRKAEGEDTEDDDSVE